MTIEIPQIDVARLAADLEEGVPLFDVREPDEYAAGHVSGAVLLPLSELDARLDEVPTDSAVNLICRSGARSQTAAERLAEHGRLVRNVTGGTMAWVDAGYRVVSE